MFSIFSSDGDATYTFLKYFTRILIILLIQPLHECAHAWTAAKLGDDTAQVQGRKTLNPFAHLDPFGSLCLLLAGFGWAKPVPVNPLKFDRKHSMRGGMALTAAAGPISNLIAAAVMMIAFRVYWCFDEVRLAWSYYEYGSEKMGMLVAIYYVMYFFIRLNLGLAVFNLIPVPPLDGSRIVGFFTGPKLERFVNQNQQTISVVFLFLIVSGIFSRPLTFLTTGIYRLLTAATNWIPSLLGSL